MKECRLNDLAVRYDPETGEFSNAPGVQVGPRGFGCIDGISNLFEFDLGDRVLVHRCPEIGAGAAVATDSP